MMDLLQEFWTKLPGTMTGINVLGPSYPLRCEDHRTDNQLVIIRRQFYLTVILSLSLSGRL